VDVLVLELGDEPPTVGVELLPTRWEVGTDLDDGPVDDPDVDDGVPRVTPSGSAARRSDGNEPGASDEQRRHRQR